MPYVPLGFKLNREDCKNGWRMRISVDPLSIQKGSPGNKIEVIKSILKDKLKNFPADAKIWELQDDTELFDRCNGTTSNLGLDRDERGKMVCIYFNDSDQQQPSIEEYKKFILSLWQALQIANVPLLFIDIPGDCKILGPHRLYTPFSFTSEKSKIGWKDKHKHGLVFKQFKGYDNKHPILQVEFTEQDLRDADIHFHSSQIIRNTNAYISQNQKFAKNKLQDEINLIAASNTNTYREVLFNDVYIKAIKDKLREYKKTVATLPEDERGSYQTEFGKTLEKFHAYKRLVEDYPHEPTSSFPVHKCILDGLCSWQCLSLIQFDEVIEKLRNEYDDRINDVKNDFAMHTDIKKLRNIKMQLSTASKLQKNIAINWNEYFPDQNIERLIELNPQRMQVMYRRIVFLEREKQAYQAYQERYAAVPVIDITPDANVVALKKEFAKALSGIQTYITRPREVFSFQTHLGFFARLFQNGRGLKRAQVYQDILSNDNYSLKQKALTLYALLATTNGTQLKEDVAEAILGPGNRNISEARAQISRLVQAVCQSVQNIQHHNEIVHDIVNYANSATVGNATDIPPSTWNGINDVVPLPSPRQ